MMRRLPSRPTLVKAPRSPRAHPPGAQHGHPLDGPWRMIESRPRPSESGGCSSMIERRTIPHIAAAVAAAALLTIASPAAAELRVFVTNEKSDDVTVIEAATGRVIAT